MSILTGSSADDQYIGTTSSDTAVINAASVNASFSYENGRWVVTSPDGTDTLTSVEAIQFNSEVFSLSDFRQARVNTYVTSHQTSQSVVGLEDGGYVIVWQSTGQDGSADGIYAQRYNSAGHPVDGEFRVNTQTANDQRNPVVTALDDGGYVIVWQSFKQDGSSYGIYAQRYTSDGLAIGQPAQINTYANNTQDHPAVSALANGGYVITWQSYGQDGSNYGVYAQRFSDTGVAMGSETKVNTYTASFQGNPAVTSLADGGYVITWQSYGQDKAQYEIYAQRFNSAGVAEGDEIRINTFSSGDQAAPSVTSLADGGYVITWQSFSQDGDLYGIYAQRFDRNGEAVGVETRVNNYVSRDQDSVSVTGLSDGGYVITWVSYGQDGSLYGIYARRYDSDGEALSLETRVSISSTSYQGTPKVTALNDGGYIISWSANDGNGKGVYAQRFNKDGSLLNITGDANANTLNYSGDMSITLSGLSGNDVLTGGSGNDHLDGGLGNDTMTGGLGNDTYVVDSSGDVVIEASSLESEFDTVESAVSYTLGNNLESLTLTETANINGTGNALNNTIKGNAANNILDGGLGSDKLIGGLGNDTYIVNSTADVVIETSTLSTEIDQVISSVTYILAENVENITLTGTAAINATGNSGDNIIVGNNANNILNGGLGNDYINGMGGKDTLYIDAGTSTEVNYSYDATTGYIIAEGTTDGNAWKYTLINVEQVQVGSKVTSLTTLFPQAFSRPAVLLVAVTSDQSTLKEGETATITFTLSAASSDFTLSDVTVSGGTLSNFSGSGTSYTATFTPDENSTEPGLVSVGSNKLSNAAGTFNVDGSDVNNTVSMVVDTAAPTIDAYNPDDGTAAVMTDANIVITFSESIKLANAGTVVLKSDTTIIATYDVKTPGNRLIVNDNILTINPSANLDTATTYTIEISDGAIVDLAGNAFLQSSTYSFTTLSTNVIVGTVGADTMTGTIGDDRIAGLAGNDFLDGGAGSDQLVGGAGNDQYVVDDAGDLVTEGLGLGADLIRSSIDYTLVANVEDLILTDGTSNGGTDNLSGTGNALSNTLMGNAGDNTLDGGAGIDRLIGGAGDDVYIVDLTAAGKLEDRITETQNANNEDSLILRGIFTRSKNIDLVLATYLENLDASATGSSRLNLIGNAGDNSLIGNSANNLLDGKSGVDEMAGGDGDDTYVVSNVNDVVTEDASHGTDLVRVAIQIKNGSYTLTENVENGTLTNTIAFSLEGNAQDNTLLGNAAANTLSGDAGADVLNGGKGADILVGGDGDDSYYVDNRLDVVSEVGGSGTDTVYSTVSYALNTTEAAGVERLTLTGSKKTNATGNGLDNTLTGNAASNMLDGGLGADTLTGGAGKDFFVFKATDYTSETDTVTDFMSGADKLQFSATVFTSLQTDVAVTAKGVSLKSTDFISGTSVTASSNTGAHLLYDTDSGTLFYDADGAGANAGVEVALLGAGTTLLVTDLQVIL